MKQYREQTNMDSLEDAVLPDESVDKEVSVTWNLLKRAFRKAALAISQVETAVE